MSNKILLSFFLAFYFNGFGQNELWTLQRCMDEAVKNAIDIKISQLQIKKAQKEHFSVANQWLPSISFSGSQSYNFGSTIDPATNGRVSSNIQNDNFFLNAQTNLIDFKAFANAQRTKIDVERAKAELEVLENEYQLQVLESFYQALFSQELLKIQKEQFKNTQFNLNRIEKEVALGNKPKSDWYDMQFSYTQEELKILETEQLVTLHKKQLFQLMNTTNVNSAEVVLANEITSDSVLINETFNNPRIRVAALNLQANQKEIQLRKAENWPTLTTFYSFSTFYYKPLNQPNVVVDDFNTQINNNKNHQLGIQVNVPVFNGFRNLKRTSAIKIETQKAKLAVEKESQKVKNQLDTEVLSLSHFQQLGVKLSEVKKAADASFNTSQAKFTSGVIDAIAFSSVKNQRLSVEYDCLKNLLQQQFTALKIRLIQGSFL